MLCDKLIHMFIDVDFIQSVSAEWCECDGRCFKLGTFILKLCLDLSSVGFRYTNVCLFYCITCVCKGVNGLFILCQRNM
jgi:hypothetical protein